MNKDKLLEDVAEVVTEEEFEGLLEKENPKSYWGVAPTGAPHLGYYRVAEKQQHLMDEGFNHTILIADLHGFLDDEKTPWEAMEPRSEAYIEAFKKLGLDESDFIRGSEFQKSDEYIDDLYQSLGKVSTNRAERAASEVVRQDSPDMGSLTYPIMQNLDTVHLDSDLAVGGMDQRHVYMLGREMLPELGYEAPVFMFTPLGKSMDGNKMSASEESTKITLWEEEESVEEKIQSAYCPPNEVEDNPVVDYVSHFVFPQLGEFTIPRSQEYGGDLEYTHRENFEEDYREGEIHPADLKPAAASSIYEALSPVREHFDQNPRLKEAFE